MSKTVDYSVRGWGHDYMIHLVSMSGEIVHASGWCADRLKPGDYLILPGSRGGTTRYQVESVEQESNPPDQWHAVLRFAPRSL